MGKSGIWRLDDATFIGVDHAAGDDIHTECEVQMNADGSMTILDIRQFPTHSTKESE